MGSTTDGHTVAAARVGQCVSQQVGMVLINRQEGKLQRSKIRRSLLWWRAKDHALTPHLHEHEHAGNLLDADGWSQLSTDEMFYQSGPKPVSVQMASSVLVGDASTRRNSNCMLMWNHVKSPVRNLKTRTTDYEVTDAANETRFLHTWRQKRGF